MRCFYCFLAAFTPCFLVISGYSLMAQTISVQQPIVRSFGAATTVLVPDHGEAHIGSLGIARESRAQYGPRFGFPRGSSISRDVIHHGLSVRATIHSLDEMDQMLLAQPPGAPPLPFEDRTRFRRSRFSSLPYGFPVAPNPVNRPLIHAPPPGWIRPIGPAEEAIINHDFKRTTPLLKVGKVSSRVAKQYLDKGIQAEQQKNKTLAEIYYRLAIRNGSQEAQLRLERLSSGVK